MTQEKSKRHNLIKSSDFYLCSPPGRCLVGVKEALGTSKLGGWDWLRHLQSHIWIELKRNSNFSKSRMFSLNYLFEGEHVHSGSPIGRFVLLWKQQWRIPGWIVSNESRLKISRSLLIIGFSGDFKIFATILWTIDELPSSSQVSSDLEETPVRGSKVPTSIRALLHTLLPSYGRKKTMILQWAVAAFVETRGSGRLECFLLPSPSEPAIATTIGIFATRNRTA